MSHSSVTLSNKSWTYWHSFKLSDRVREREREREKEKRVRDKELGRESKISK